MNIDRSNRPRVLIGAYAFGPSDEPEASAGWAFALAAAADHDVWVVCRRRFVQEIKDFLTTDVVLAKHLHVIHIDLPDKLRRTYRRPWDLYWNYILWQKLAARTAKRLHAEVHFDVVHHVTFANDWMPAGVAQIKSVPFVWGPVGGATRIPIWRLRRWLGFRGVVYEIARGLLTGIPRRIWGDANARRACVVAVQNEDVAHRYRRARRVVIEPNASLDATLLPQRTLPNRLGRQAVFVGRLIPLKGGSIAIASLAHAQAQVWSLEIYGAGPEEAALLSLARRLGVSDRVMFHGHCPRQEALDAMSKADVLLFPSMHDQAGWAAAEASSMGTPVVCLPLGGPPTLAQPNAYIVSLDGDLIFNVVTAMNRAAVEGGVPHSRWSQERLREVVTEWYCDARKGVM